MIVGIISRVRWWLKVYWYVGLGIVDVGKTIVGNGFEIDVEYGFVGSWSGFSGLLNRCVGWLSVRSRVGRSVLTVIYASR
jgi:hypothetical protein